MATGNFVASYNAKDLILYALSVGFGSTRGEKGQEYDLRFLYEKHPQFSAVPTFCLVLVFWAKQSCEGTSQGLHSFPPEIMAASGVLPARFLRVAWPVSTVLHTWQSIRWHRQLPIPSQFDPSIRAVLRTKTRSVVPKSGTFVTSETTISLPSTSQAIQEELLCTLMSTALVVGIPSEYVIPFDTGLANPKSKPEIPYSQSPLFEWTYQTTSNQALLYRMASGDTNHIHVEPVSKTIGIPSSRALLHGLCTLGIVARAILEMHRGKCSFSYLEGRFTKPVLVGDELVVKVWNAHHARHNPSSSETMGLLFIMLKTDTNEIVVDHGYLEISNFVQEIGKTNNKSKL